jgi:hypothetical protein
MYENFYAVQIFSNVPLLPNMVSLKKYAAEYLSVLVVLLDLKAFVKFLKWYNCCFSRFLLWHWKVDHERAPDDVQIHQHTGNLTVI